MGKYRILSGDDHIFEPIDLWDERLSPKNRGRLRVERDEDGSDWWISDDFRVLPMSPRGPGRAQVGGAGKVDSGRHLRECPGRGLRS